MEKKNTRYAVIGAGHGGMAMAAHLSLKGFPVKLYNRSEEKLKMVQETGGIHLDEGSQYLGFGKLESVTNIIEEAVSDVDVIMVVVPAYAHADIARKAAPHLKDDQIIILHPGRTLGALEFRNVLETYKCTADVLVAETQTFIYASRSDGKNRARIFQCKERVSLAAFPATDTAAVLKAIQPAYPQFFDSGNILETGLNNLGGVFHPTISLLNAGWIESEKDFEFYTDGASKTVSRVLNAVDLERVRLATLLGVRPVSAIEWLRISYNAHGKNLYQAIRNQHGYRGILAPTSLDHRYMHEDIPMSLIPMASIGRHFNIPMPTIESIIQLAVIANKQDYWLYGRTLSNLGLNILGLSDLVDLVNGEKKKEETFQAPGAVPGRLDAIDHLRRHLPEDPNTIPGTSLGGILPN